MKELNIISLGAGLQSSCLYFMSSMGELPRADYAIFADPGREKKKTMEYVLFMQKWAERNNGIPIMIVNRKNLYKDLMNQVNSTGQRVVGIPLFTKNNDGSVGMLRRQCTSEYKIIQVDWQIRQIYELRPRQWTPKTVIWHGITLDEKGRMNNPVASWKTVVYPFIGYGFTKTDYFKIKWAVLKNRQDCEAWFIARGLPVPPKSSCTFCPYQSDAAWLDLKINDPEEFELLCQLDEAIRRFGTVMSNCYLYKSCVPLREIEFTQMDLWHGNCASDCHV